MRTMLLVVCVSARTASADVAPPDPAKSPGFVLLDRFDAESRAGAEWSHAGFEDTHVERYDRHLDLHAHIVEPHTRLGVYAQYQSWKTFDQSPPSDVGQPYHEQGAPELGAFYVPRVAPTLAIAFRAGITMPVWDYPYQSDAQDVRPTDYAQHKPEAVVRLSVSPMLRSGRFFGRADFGLGRGVYRREGYADYPYTLSFEGNLGAGVELAPTVAVMAELSTLLVGAVSVRGRLRWIEPYAALVVPVMSDEIEPSWAITVGVDVAPLAD